MSHEVPNISHIAKIKKLSTAIFIALSCYPAFAFATETPKSNEVTDNEGSNWVDLLNKGKKVNDKKLTELSDTEVQQALEIVRLKQAVEAGLISEVALETYAQDLVQKNSNLFNRIHQKNELNNNNTATSFIIGNAKDVLADLNGQSQKSTYQMLTEKELQSQLDETSRQAENNAQFNMPVAKLGSTTQPIGLDITAVDSIVEPAQTKPTANLTNALEPIILPTDQSPVLSEDNNSSTNISSTNNSAPTNNSFINDTLNSLESNQDKDDVTESSQKGNLFEQVYANLFNDGQLPLARVNSNIYIRSATQANGEKGKLITVDTDKQPAKNIKAAIDNFPVDMVTDFMAALPLIRTAAKDAAEAVGYYDVKMKFTQPDSKQIDVVIESLGEPVVVENRVVKVGGEGENFEPYQNVRDKARLQVGDVFNHHQYKQTKGAIEAVSSQYGYFDGDWLERSVDIILPDNVADMSLVYESGNRYAFDDIVFFTRDKKTGELTSDPDKLPVKKELLEQLVSYQVNEGYDSSKIVELTNDLFATRYFDGIHVESILPTKKSAKNADEWLDFEDSAGTEPSEQPDENALLDEDTTEEEIAPLEFSIDETTTQKLEEIQAKADRLYNAPDDAVLDEIPYETKSILGKLSNAISDVATKILPDEVNQPLLETDGKAELAGKQTPEDVEQSKKVPVYVMVTADKPRDAEFGVGYGTDTGFRVRSKFDNNLLNRDGYKAGVEGFWSNVEKGATAYVSRPWKHPLNDTLNGSVSYKEEQIDQGKGNFDLTTRSYLGSVSRNIISDNGWNRNYSLRYRRDDLQTGVEQSEYENLPVRFTSGNPRQEALLLGYALNKTVADSITNPKKGWKQHYSLEVGAEGALTDTNLVIAKAGTSGIYSFGESDKHQVLGKLDAGYLWSNNFTDVPYQLRFFAGGDQSIRGYDYKSLSPLENGYLTGGEILAVGSAEYNYEFIPGLRAAIFTDVGNAYDKDFTTDTKVGTGLGIRWASPIGPVRLDVAAGVSEENKPIRLHFFIGSPL
ncbi:BamA/TamA family outer membrane protein [Psychrobacter sp. HD31]|uniref:autotransporter assembly complex protein TamA n=1 Tax=Psychrobacter sp. HD31 TaxID=3112003 RepID=UPI003DA3AB90